MTSKRLFAHCSLGIALSITVLSGCSSDPAAEAAAKQLIGYMNTYDFASLWEMVSTESKEGLKAQLDRNRTNPLGRQVISSFGIAPADIDSLSPDTYFLAIMKFAQKSTPADAWASEFESISVDGNEAEVQWRKSNGTTGTTKMVKEAGEWRVHLEYP